LACTHIIPFTTWDIRNRQPGLFTCYDPAALIAQVKEAKGQCDVLFVMLHWGFESKTRPETYESGLGHSLIDAGADAVIGTHPHSLQGIEYYNGKPIFFSLGDFIFDDEIDQTMLLKAGLDPKSKELSYSLIPAYAAGAVTNLATESEDAGKADAVFETVRSASENAEISPEGVLTEKGAAAAGE
ncbi:MAG: CapA family protein, partial [Lachnospiraceae bacterium]|nr:CapA family protein [Lachnospiraceae bacterium]